MRAWAVEQPGPVDGGPLRPVERAVPEPAPAEVLVEVSVCGVCRTDLHVAEGDLPPRRPAVVPGHEIVGRVVARGVGATRFALGDRIGVPWLRHTCGACRFCVRGDENLCVAPRFTGWDDDGGYAEFAVVDEAYAYALPDAFDDEQAAPLLCAGIIGYRALDRAAVPDGGRLGVYGFGGSAHLAAQIAVHRGATVHVHDPLGAGEAARPRARLRQRDRRPTSRRPRCSMRRSSSRPRAISCRTRSPPSTAAARWPSPASTSARCRRSTTQAHLFQERQVRSVTANTRADGAAFLQEAVEAAVRVQTSPYPLAEADRALADLAHGRVDGAAVLRVR